MSISINALQGSVMGPSSLNEVLLCRDTNYSIHNQDIDSFYKSIMSVFMQATIECIPSSSNGNKTLCRFPGGMNTLETPQYC